MSNNDGEQTSGEEAANDVRDKFSKRFDSGKQDSRESQNNGEGNESRSSSDTQSNSETDDNRDKHEQRDTDVPPWNAEHIKRLRDSWGARTYYVPSEVAERLDRVHDRLQYECRDLDVKTGRHVTPVLFEHGLQDLEEMNADEFTEALDELGVPTE